MLGNTVCDAPPLVNMAAGRPRAPHSFKESLIHALAPVDTRTENQLQAILDWAAQHAFSGQAGSP
jgi:hypothetical protein